MNWGTGDTQRELGTLRRYNGTMGNDNGLHIGAHYYLVLHLTTV